MQPLLRKVTPSDLKDILEISRHVWEGQDYLPKVIEKWLKDPNSYTYGIEVDGHLVSLDNLRLIEDGRTGWLEGLRVHPDYRGRGLAKKLTEHMMREAQRLKVQRMRYTTGTDNTASLKLAERGGFVQLLEMGVFWHPNPEITPSSKDYPPIEKGSFNEVYELVQRNPQIIPLGVLVYNWKARDYTLEGFRTIGETNEFHVALRKNRIDSLSIGGPRYEPEDSPWSFTIYATDSHGFQSQLSHQISLAHAYRHTAIMCTYETKFEKILHVMDWLSEEHWGMRMVLLEKSML